eukprot:311899_1
MADDCSERFMIVRIMADDSSEPFMICLRLPKPTLCAAPIVARSLYMAPHAPVRRRASKALKISDPKWKREIAAKSVDEQVDSKSAPLEIPDGEFTPVQHHPVVGGVRSPEQNRCWHPLYKTKLFEYYADGRSKPVSCLRRDDCYNTHGSHEERRSVKLEHCDRFQSGPSIYGNSCRYINQNARTPRGQPRI